jgi:sRNA-binding regulator protein Hfq
MRYNNDRRHFRGNPQGSGRSNHRPGRPPMHGANHPPSSQAVRTEDRPERSLPEEISDPTATGSEAAYWRTLIDSKLLVTVLLTTGERMRGRIRYYDRDMLSLGQEGGGPNIFLPKHSIHQIIEE